MEITGGLRSRSLVLDEVLSPSLARKTSFLFALSEINLRESDRFEHGISRGLGKETRTIPLKRSRTAPVACCDGGILVADGGPVAPGLGAAHNIILD
ncbi:hypothetical protein HPP92_028876 [Vanilla planifolia]|uniref:Uncharacterized protein n=1 Tax=Vanilla planifolia TaxID=51239 RepID=A0A835P5R3_VANPL|nr:hypothetical protein HPP92_028876 [Vanilla planifolia]KAG0446363.1 hypothetical protein HPP92_028865 [Vanilla planifolia]